MSFTQMTLIHAKVTENEVKADFAVSILNNERSRVVVIPPFTQMWALPVIRGKAEQNSDRNPEACLNLEYLSILSPLDFVDYSWSTRMVWVNKWTLATGTGAKADPSQNVMSNFHAAAMLTRLIWPYRFCYAHCHWLLCSRWDSTYRVWLCIAGGG